MTKNHEHDVDDDLTVAYDPWASANRAFDDDLTVAYNPSDSTNSTSDDDLTVAYDPSTPTGGASGAWNSNPPQLQRPPKSTSEPWRPPGRQEIHAPQPTTVTTATSPVRLPKPTLTLVIGVAATLALALLAAYTLLRGDSAADKSTNSSAPPASHLPAANADHSDAVDA